MKILTMMCAAAMTLCGAMYAQSVDTIKVHFAMPVTIGETALPAGDCIIRVLHASDNIVLEVRSEAAAGNPVLVQANRIVNSEDAVSGSATVVLSHRNNSYQVDRIVLADHSGFQLLDAPAN